MPMMGRSSFEKPRSVRMRRVASTPSRTGMCWSMSTSEKGRRRSASSASAPFRTTTAVWPILVSTSVASFWFTALSSATSTVSGAPRWCWSSSFPSAAWWTAAPLRVVVLDAGTPLGATPGSPEAAAAAAAPGSGGPGWLVGPAVVVVTSPGGDDAECSVSRGSVVSRSAGVHVVLPGAAVSPPTAWCCGCWAVSVEPRDERSEAVSSASSSTRTAKGSSNQKVLPWPGADRTPMVPPIASTSAFEMASPRPVPPNRRATETSVCWNDWNSFPRSASAMPMPVSTTSNRTRAHGAASPFFGGVVAVPEAAEDDGDEPEFAAAAAAAASSS
mmetsp:Transcript_19861/g.79172  ORF Transcript_19861/g.79172 Transcript_19861/m.79172 type:complete len:330 (+) Transcript_19861:326-1315(+)